MSVCASRMSSVHRWGPWIREHIRVPRELCQYFFSPKTCFHSASADDLGSNELNFVFLVAQSAGSFFFEILVRCLHWLGFVRPIFLGPICCAHFLIFHRSSLCRAQKLCPLLSLIQNLTRPCGRAQWTALMPSGTLLCRTHSKLDVPMFRA